MVESLVPKKISISIETLPVFNNSDFIYQPMDEIILNFLSNLSKKILKDLELRVEPSYAALGFWLRKSNIKKIVNENKDIFLMKNVRIKPIGIVFHLCPSNVDTMFFYSLAIALLAGNKNIVRISSRLKDPLIDKLFLLINELIESEFQLFINYLNIIKYEHEEQYNQAVSLESDARIIWGGDETINQFKAIKTKPKVKDLYFADRISLSLINAKTVLGLNDNEILELSKNLYNDIYTFDQKGCSSPHSIFLLGNKKETEVALNILYNKISKIAETNYINDINSMASVKFNRLAEDIISNDIIPAIYKNNYLTITELTKNKIPHTCGLGYIYYKSINNIKDLMPYLNEKIQTIGYFGLTKKELYSLQNNSIADRIVPVGKALDFDYIWDGYNILMEMLSFKYII